MSRRFWKLRQQTNQPTNRPTNQQTDQPIGRPKDRVKGKLHFQQLNANLSSGRLYVCVIPCMNMG